MVDGGWGDGAELLVSINKFEYMGWELDWIWGSAGCMYLVSVYDHSAAATNTSFLVYMVVLLAWTGYDVDICLTLQQLQSLLEGKKNTKVKPLDHHLSHSASTIKREVQ